MITKNLLSICILIICSSIQAQNFKEISLKGLQKDEEIYSVQKGFNLNLETDRTSISKLEDDEFLILQHSVRVKISKEALPDTLYIVEKPEETGRLSAKLISKQFDLDAKKRLVKNPYAMINLKLLQSKRTKEYFYLPSDIVDSIVTSNVEKNIVKLGIKIKNHQIETKYYILQPSIQLYENLKHDEKYLNKIDKSYEEYLATSEDASKISSKLLSYIREYRIYRTNLNRSTYLDWVDSTHKANEINSRLQMIQELMPKYIKLKRLSYNLDDFYLMLSISNQYLVF